MAPIKAFLHSNGETLPFSVVEHSETADRDNCDGLSDVSDTPSPSADDDPRARPRSTVSDDAAMPGEYAEAASDSDVDVEGLSPLVVSNPPEPQHRDRHLHSADESEAVPALRSAIDFEPAAFNGLVDSIKLAQSQREIVDLLLSSRQQQQQQYQPQLNQHQHQHYAAAVAAAAAAADFADAVAKSSAAAAAAAVAVGTGGGGGGYMYASQLNLLPQSNGQQFQHPHQQRMQAAAAAAAAAVAAAATAVTHGKGSPFSASSAPHFLPASSHFLPASPPSPLIQQQQPQSMQPLPPAPQPPPHRPDLLRSLSLPPISPCLMQLDGKTASYPATPLGFVSGNGVFKLALPPLDFPLPPPSAQSQQSTPNAQTSPMVNLSCYHPSFAAQYGQQQPLQQLNQQQPPLLPVGQLKAAISRVAQATTSSRQHQFNQVQQQPALLQHYSLKRPCIPADAVAAASASAPVAPKRRKRGGAAAVTGASTAAAAVSLPHPQELPELLDQEEIKLFQRVAPELFVWHGQKPMIHLFLLKLLDNSRCHNNIEWVDKGNRLFKVITPSTIAKLWKHIKGNKTDNYECFARGIRHSRDIGRYFEPHEFRKKKIYKFSLKAIEDYQSSLLVAAAGSANDSTAAAGVKNEAATAGPVPSMVVSVKLEEREQSPVDSVGSCAAFAVESLLSGEDEKRQLVAAPSGGHAMPNPEVLERLKNKLAERRQSNVGNNGCNGSAAANESFGAAHGSNVDWNCNVGSKVSVGSRGNVGSTNSINKIIFSGNSVVVSSSHDVGNKVENFSTCCGSSDGCVTGAIRSGTPGGDNSSVKLEKLDCILTASGSVYSEAESTDSATSASSVSLVVAESCGRQSAGSVTSEAAESSSGESANEEAALVIATCVT